MGGGGSIKGARRTPQIIGLLKRAGTLLSIKL